MRTRQGETICLGEWIRPASADFPPAGGVWGGMRAGFGLGVFGKNFCASETGVIKKPSVFVVSKIAKTLGVDIEELIK